MKVNKIDVILIVLLAVLMLSFLKKDSIMNKFEKPTIESTFLNQPYAQEDKLFLKNNLLQDNGAFIDIIGGNKQTEIISEENYNIDPLKYQWQEIDFQIELAKIVTINQFKDNDNKEYNAILALRYHLENNSETYLKLYPEKVNIVLNNNTQKIGIGYIDYWEKLFKKGEKFGFAHFLIQDIKQINDIKQIEVHFIYFKDNDKEDYKVNNNKLVLKLF